MSAFTKQELEMDGNSIMGHRPENCFYCGESLFNSETSSTGGFVHWHGRDAAIDLHQVCAEQLGLHLIQDARSLVTKTRKRNKLSVQPVQNAEKMWYVK